MKKKEEWLVTSSVEKRVKEACGFVCWLAVKRVKKEEKSWLSLFGYSGFEKRKSLGVVSA